ncbi:MAG TPA: Ig-like domain-containing protein [Opitutaceae bacterium]|nr:Ig-like domain-containing protein [Opitutaceae bacterium]
MKISPRILFGAVVALFAASAAWAQSLSPAGIAATPASGLPGDTITYTVTVNNSATTQFASGATANFTIVFTNLTTGTSFQVGPVSAAPTTGLIGAATTDPTTNQTTPGVGTFTITAALPTQTLQAGNYRATVTLNSVSVGTIGTPTYSVATNVLTVTGNPDFRITNLTYASSTSYVGGNVIPMSLTYINAVSTGGVYNVPYNPATNKTNNPVRIQIVLSSNPQFGDADDFQLTFFDVTTVTNADGAAHTITWNQLLPGNFSGSYYVLAKIDSLNAIDETGEAAAKPLDLNVFLDVSATKVTLQPTAFPTLYVASMAGSSTASGYSDNPSVSSDGRYTVFVSDAANLVTGDTNGTRDVFVYDNQTSVVRRLSVSQQGKEANGASNNPAISADGRYVAFSSDATNLVFGDTNGFTDIFVVDAITGTITRESISSAGAQANGASFHPSLSQDGRYLVFESTATNLVSPATTPGVTHIYWRDRTTGTTTLVSQSTAGVAGNASSMQPVVSGDGNYVAFASDATNLVGNDTNAARDIFLRNVPLATTTRINVGPGGIEATGGSSHSPAINQDGHYIVFSSDAPNLVTNDTNAVSDVFVYDRVAATTKRMSVSSSGAQGLDPTDPTTVGSAMGSFNPTISADGRYVAFASLDNNLAPGDDVGQYNPSGSGNSALNIYVMDRDVGATGTFDTPGNINTRIVSVDKFGYQAYYILNIQSTAAADIQPAISGDGRYVAFPTDAESAPGLIHSTTNLLSPDSNNARDVVLFDRRINTLPNNPVVPTVSITSPSGGGTYPVNSPIDVIAKAATTIGSVASVQFFVNGNSLGSPITAFPYVTTWTPTGTGTYNLSALVTDSFGNQGVSNTVTVTVGPGAPPVVTITSPADGSTVTVNTAQTVSANATSPNGTIKSVQFFANGGAIGSPVTKAPYSVSWTPTTAGAYTITATAFDTGGISTTSSPITVMAAPVAVAASVVYTGNYAAGAESGNFSFIDVGGTDGTLIAYSTSNPPHVYVFPGLTISSTGAFSGVDSTGTVSVSGRINDTGISGTFDNQRVTFIGPVVTTSTSSSGSAGYYAGSLAGKPSTGLSAIVGADGSINLTVSNGSTIDAGGGMIDSTGAFSVKTSQGTQVSGKIDPTSHFMTGTVSGTNGGNIVAALATGPSFSDGTLRNISTRGQVGTGDAILIGGFVVRGSAAKQVLIRAVGPTLGSFGVTGTLATPVLQLYDSSNNLVAMNDNRVTDSAGVAAAAARAGAFPLPAGSSDAAALMSLAPGGYTAQVSGLGGTTGVALMEVYDLDTATAYTSQKLVNVSTRGFVGSGSNPLIAGFIVSGTIPKRVLIRAVGPTLAQEGVSTAIADPMLRVSHTVNNADVEIRENDNWEQGNDPALVADATAKVGAFALGSGSKDAVILITLPPGVYTAQASGVNNTTGLALIEVYEVP